MQVEERMIKQTVKLPELDYGKFRHQNNENKGTGKCLKDGQGGAPVRAPTVYQAAIVRPLKGKK